MADKLVYQVRIEEDIKMIEMLLDRIYGVSRVDELWIHDKLEDIRKEINELKIYV